MSRLRPLAILLCIGASCEFLIANIADRIQLNVPGLSVRTICEIQPGLGTCAIPIAGDPNGQIVRFGPYDNLEVGALHDALGRLYGMEHQSYNCGGTTVTDVRVFRLNADNTAEVVLVFSGCQAPRTGVYLREMIVDATNGKLTLRGGSGMDTETVIEVSGLPTLLDIILSYQPPSTLSFNVPVRPEGLPGSDSFALYAGDLATVSDLSQAAPLQCTVPGRPPVPGEQLTVPDTLPDPAAGAGRYYLAAVRHGTQLRVGRSTNDGQMHGRNAAALPACAP